MKNGLYTRIYKKAFTFIVFLLVFGVAFGFASLNKIKATTQYYDEDLKDYVLNDWENYETKTQAGITMTNQGDGTFLVNGTATAVTEFILPLTITNITNTYTYDWYMMLLYNNAFSNSFTNVRMYLAYNNGQNITSHNAYLGRTGSGFTSESINNVCLLIRFNQDATFSNVVFTPFFCMRYREDGTSYNFANQITINYVNQLLGPEQASPDLTKVNYIQEAQNISLVISSQINKSFGNELENIMQYSFNAGDTITVENDGVAASTIDLLTMTAGYDTYKMTFINDPLNNDYLNIFLYKNNDATLFYNDNLGEISAQNITNFREWGVDAINNGATITSATAYDNNIINKIFVYSTGTNYETGYLAGYNDARADVEEEIQEAYGDGLEQGFQDGYTDGYGEGYDQGAIDGVDSSWLINLFGAVDTFFSIHLLPNLTIGTLFAIPFVLSIAWVIIRILRGGGYGD